MIKDSSWWIQNARIWQISMINEPKHASFGLSGVYLPKIRASLLLGLRICTANIGNQPSTRRACPTHEVRKEAIVCNTMMRAQNQHDTI